MPRIQELEATLKPLAEILRQALLPQPVLQADENTDAEHGQHCYALQDEFTVCLHLFGHHSTRLLIHLTGFIG
ncbi:protein of unknown function [Xenorhabdus poinarii G6]|uniref:Uncharacterized protein n=1 Tax=Xenorhabdus poinarii G6 TaxID=1354304 RepID=A0A068R7K6_9GAMM|nr:hypothetical protein [Xenorhabdus poinarii]CDG22906.1 protein of unknown function [Xenorhabdus poinarii G6]